MNTLTYDQTTEENNFGIPADLEPARFRYTVALDNYEPAPRETDSGTIVRYWQHSRRDGEHPTPRAPAWMFSRDRIHPGMRDETKAVYLIDDGASVQPFYVAAWGKGTVAPLYPEGAERHVILHPFPTSSIRDARDGRPVDFGNWAMGPRRAYHFKITPEA